MIGTLRSVKILLILVPAFCVPAVLNAQEPVNLIINGDMEEMALGSVLPKGWKEITFPRLETICEVKTADTGHGGTRSIETAWRSGLPRFGVSPSLNRQIQGKGKFEFSVYCRTEPEGKGYLAMVGFDEKNEQIQSQVSSGSIADQQDWRRLSWTFYTYPEVKSVRLYCLSGGKGRVWFDDVSLCQLILDKKQKARMHIDATCEPVDGNGFWQDGKRIFNTITASPCPLSFVFQGNARKFNNPKLVIEVSAEVDIPEFDFTWGGRMSSPGKYQRLTAQKQEISREKQSYFSYIVSLPEVWANAKTVGLSESGPKITCYFERSQKTAKAADETYAIFWHLENDSGKSKEQDFTLRFLPPMEKTRNPKRFTGANFFTTDLNMEDLSLLDRVLNKYEEAGMAETSIGIRNTDKVGKRMLERGWDVGVFIDIDMYHFYSAWMPADLRSIVRWSVNPDGVAESGKNATPCPNFVLNNPEFKAEYKKSIIGHDINKVSDGTPVMLDYEPFGLPAKKCFCGECIKDFSRRYKIPMEKLTDPQKILKDYWVEWGRYWSYLYGRAAEEICAIIRETHPNSPINMYGYIQDYVKKEKEKGFFGCPLNPLILDEHIDKHLLLIDNFAGNDLLDGLDMVIPMLKKPVAVNPRVSRSRGATGGYTTVDSQTSPALLRTRLIASAASGAIGFNIYPGMYYDGMFFKEIDRAMEEIAILEDFYMDGQRCDNNFTISTDSLGRLKKYVGLRGHKSGRQFLVTFLNFHKTSDAYIPFSAALPTRGKAFAVWDPTREVMIKNKRGKVKWTRNDLKGGIEFKIPASDVMFLIIGPYGKRPRRWEGIEIDSAGRIPVQEQGKFERLIRGDTKIINGEDIDQDGIPEIVMETRNQKLWISPGAEAHIVQWQDKRDDLFICERGSRKDMAADICWDLIWWPEDHRPKGARPQECDTIKTDIAGGLPVIKTSFKRKADRIVVEKAYRLSDEYLDVKYVIRNMSDEEHEISFWSHNCPTVGLKNDLLNKSSVIVITPAGIGPMITADRKDKTTGVKPYIEAFYEAIGVKGLGLREGALRGKISSGVFAFYVPETKRALRVDLEFDKLLQIYTYAGPKVRTMEWMYRKVILGPGEEWKTEFRLTSLLDIETARDAVGNE